eukprot:m.400006 g.400006  ORF g.400006 m.400006 type:complete len:270 (+) comp56439_c0_seq2:150-959(+)
MHACQASLSMATRNLKALKVPELKQECTTLGLSTAGTKAELISRIEQYDLEHPAAAAQEEEVTLDQELEKTSETEVLEAGDATEAESTKEAEQPATALTAADEAAKKAARAAKFGAVSEADDEEEKRKARASKFGAIDEDAAKKAARAAKFGHVSEHAEEDAKKAARAAKFGQASETAEDAAKKAARAAKFGVADPAEGKSEARKGQPRIDPLELEKLKERALRFQDASNPSVANILEKEKAEKRKAKFGSDTDEEAKQKRLKKFGESL